MGKRLSLDQIKKKLNEYTTIYEETFVDTNSKATFVDCEYGEWTARVSDVLRGSNHPKRAAKLKTLDINELKRRLPLHIKIIESTYISTKVKARFIDDEYGEWETLPNAVLNGKGHPKRGKISSIKNRSIGLDDIKQRLPSHITLVEDTYKNVTSKATFIDSEYGEWEILPNNLFQGVEHPNRFRTRSKAEVEISNMITSLGIKVEANVKLIDGSLLEADIYIPEKKIAIEYNGLYWHSDKFKKPNDHMDKREIFNKYPHKLLHYSTGGSLAASFLKRRI